MVLSKREKNIAIITAIVVAAIVLDTVVIAPFLAKRAAIKAETDDTTQKLAQSANLFRREQKLQKVWADMTTGGLKNDDSEARRQASNSVDAWVQGAGLSLSTVKMAERATQEGKFQVVSFHVTAIGPMRAVAKLLLAMETASIPLRINDLQLTPRREGFDELSVQLGVSTLYMPQDTDKPDRASVARLDTWGNRR